MFRLRQARRGLRKDNSARLNFEILEDRCTPSAGHVFGQVHGPMFDRAALHRPTQAPSVPVADIGVTISNNVAIAAQGGDSIVFNVTVTNQGPSAATVNVQTNATGVSDLIWMAGTNGQDLGLGVGDINTNVTLASGQTAVFTMWGHVSISQGLAFNSVNVSAVGAIDPNLANNSASSGVIVV